ncbi:MAG: hypothetical protein K6G15_08010 [Desulfovibrio sp.]|nr:hypothetical protein [Desulfovibrio sp.]
MKIVKIKRIFAFQEKTKRALPSVDLLLSRAYGICLPAMSFNDLVAVRLRIICAQMRST